MDRDYRRLQAVPRGLEKCHNSLNYAEAAAARSDSGGALPETCINEQKLINFSRLTAIL